MVNFDLLMTNERYKELYKFSFDTKKEYHSKFEKFWKEPDNLKDSLWCVLDIFHAFRGMDAIKYPSINWMIDVRESVKNGSIEIENCPSFNINGKISKTPYSALSKFCHILNPQKYKFIWDNNFSIFVGKELDKGDLYAKSHWKEVCEIMEEKFKLNRPDVKDEEIWSTESKIWAYIKIKQEGGINGNLL